MRYETILLVEDSDDDVLLLKRLFAQANILNEVQVVSNVDDAVCYLKGEGVYQDRGKYPFPILVFLDLHLGGRSGFEVLEWIRTHGGPKPLGVVMLTGIDTNAIRDAYRRGTDSFLSKPLKFEDFKNVVTGLRGVRFEQQGDGYYVRFG
jgi:CheY-like chemotaxis protein